MDAGTTARRRRLRRPLIAGSAAAMACGNCTVTYERHVVIDNDTLDNVKYVAGINIDKNDTATFTRVTLYNGAKTTICAKYHSAPKGSEPTLVGTGADATNCLYTEPGDITRK